MTHTLLRRSQFARELGVAESTVTRWVRQGVVECIRLPGGERRIPQSELDRLLTPERPRAQ